MSDHPSKGPAFSLSGQAAFAAFSSLTGAFQIALEIAVFPARLKIEGDGSLGRLEALTSQLLREAKNFPTEGLSETDEAGGMLAAVTIIEDAISQMRRQI